jgi:hypothetical protein
VSAVFLAAGAVCGASAVVYAARDCAQGKLTRTPVALGAVAAILLGISVIGGAL